MGGGRFGGVGGRRRRGGGRKRGRWWQHGHGVFSYSSSARSNLMNPNYNRNWVVVVLKLTCFKLYTVFTIILTIHHLGRVHFWPIVSILLELGRGYNNKAKQGSNKMKKHASIALNLGTVFVIRIPDAQVLRILSRSLFLAMVIASLPFLGTILKGFKSSSRLSVSKFGTNFGYVNAGLLNSIIRDLAHEGLFKKDDKALIVTNGFGSVASFNNNEADLVMDSDLEMKKLFPDESYDFVFSSSNEDIGFVDRVLKIDGIVALPLGNKPSNTGFREQSNYRVAYLRRYDSNSIIVALKKTSFAYKLVDPSPKRKLLKWTNEAKTVALKGLEDVFLEPPSKSFAKSKAYLKKIKFLSNLLGDPLEGYDRRLFISVGLPEENKGVIQWFQQNYPKKNTEFETHSLLDVAPEERHVSHTDVSDWLSKHVKEEEYVVMKAEAEVVEELIKKRTINLVDELFLECKNEWWQTGKKRKRSGRAYWECLALYGMLRDEGVAVHQWWG
ncbi:hypothetical protein RIF29_41583 [Crotalaria pallida]|uniref:DUF7870 domain-containing protein n=1 Tax=Crotalaria pallida TaxID=3830 RepID=A0AAN9E8B5_CROPI